MHTVPETIFMPRHGHPQPLDGICLDRNWHLDSIPIWSCARKSTLAVSADQFKVPKQLLLEVRVFGASPQSPRTLTIMSQGHPDQPLLVHTSQPIQIRTATPRHATGASHSIISLALDRIASPIECGLSSDERLLGLQIVALSEMPTSLDLPLDLTGSVPADLPLGKGWSDIEANVGAWTIGDYAELLLPGYARPATSSTSSLPMLVLEANTLERPKTMQPLVIDVWCDGQNIHTWHIQSPPTETLRCAVPTWRDNRACKIALCLMNLQSPQELGINSDTRSLGLQLRRIDIAASES